MDIRCNVKLVTAALLASSVALLSGCGGSSSSSDDEAGSVIASRGQITGFGSIYVNEKRFATGNASFEIDDRDGLESELRIGMMVTVLGSSDADGNWSAERVYYDNELKGPISSLVTDPADPSRKTAVVLAQDVLISAATRFDEGLDFDTIKVGDVIEVSGFDSPSGLVATHIELQADDGEIEIRGEIENLSGGNFTIRGFPVSFDGSTHLEDIDAVEDGLFVEVEGHLNAAGTTLIAEEIEAEDDHIGHDRDFEIEGAIMNFDPADLTFKIQHIRVDASSATRFPVGLVLAEGLNVEVDGHFVGDVLFADEVKLRGKEIEIDAPLSAVGGSSVSFMFNATEVVVQVGSSTELEDDTGNPVSGLFDFSAGNFVELEAFEDGAGIIHATEISRIEPDRIAIEAPVDDFDEGLLTVQMLGVTFDLSAASFEDHAEQHISAAKFFSLLDIGRFIELEDRDRNAIIDRAELDD